MTKSLTTTVKNWDSAVTRVEKISDLVLDWRLYPRKEVDHGEVVENYARALRAGCVFPTVKIGLFKGKKIIVDGAHRIRAHQLEHIDSVKCSILPFDSEAELFAEAVRLNSSHGKGFTKVEVKDNIKRLKQYKFTAKDIQALTHVPACEVYREAAAPILTLMTPSGRTIGIGAKPDPQNLIDLKNALRLCLRWNPRKVPIDNAETMALIVRCHLAMGKAMSNA